MRESAVEKYFVTVSDAHDVWAVKITPVGIRGFPDRLCLMPGGKVFFAEIKRPLEHVLAKRQSKVHKALRELGFKVHVFFSKEDIDDFYMGDDFLFS